MGSLHTDPTGKLITLGGSITETAPPPTFYFNLDAQLAYDSDLEATMNQGTKWVRLSDMAESTAYQPGKSFFNAAGNYAFILGDATQFRANGRSNCAIIMDFENTDFGNLGKMENIYLRGIGTAAQPINLENINFSNAKLKALSFDYSDYVVGDITNVTFSPTFEKLNFSYSSVTGNLGDFDFSALPNLKWFVAQTANLSGDIGQIDLTGCPELENFTIGDNSIAGNIDELDITQNTKLTTLNFYNLSNVVGDVTALDLSNNPLMNIFSCRGTGVVGNMANFDFTNIPAVHYFYMDETNITGDLSGIDFSQNTLASTLDFKYCDITYNSTGSGFATHTLPPNAQIWV